jgi:hypothetical protein
LAEWNAKLINVGVPIKTVNVMHSPFFFALNLLEEASISAKAETVRTKLEKLFPFNKVYC